MPRSYGTTNAAPYATVPPVGLAGDTYFSTSAKQLYVSDGTQWLPLLQGDYFYGAFSTPTGNLGNDVYATIGWTATRSSGFTLASSGQRITVARAGRYQVTAELSFGSPTNAAGYTRAAIQQYNSAGTAITSVQNVGAGAAINSYGLATIDGIFDASVGDYFVIQGAIQNPTGNFNQALVSVVPVGGVAGPQGPDIAAAQSAYWYGQVTGPSGSFPSNTWQLLTLAQILANNTSLVTSNSITVPNAGKYLLHSQIGFANSTSNNGTMFTRVIQYSSGGTVKVTRDQIGGYAPSNPSTQFAGGFIGIFDAVAGDYFQVSAYIGSTAVAILDTRSWVALVPVGGVKGDQGIQGPAGGPVPTGGAVNQSIVKTGSADFAVGWGDQLGPLISGATDYNACTTTGLYAITGNATNGPSAGGGYGTLTVVNASGSINQTYQYFSNSIPSIWIRTYFSSWGAWKKLTYKIADAGQYTGTTNASPNNGAGPNNFDLTVWTAVAYANGWVECHVHADFGFAGSAISQAGPGLYCNSYTGAAGGAIQNYTATQSVNGATWVRSPGPATLIFPVTAGNSYPIVFRGNWSGNTNCYWNPYFSGTLYVI